MKQAIRKLIPTFALQLYHLILAHVGSFMYRHPSRELIVIGVTGTKGKSTVVNLISKVFEGAGFSTGIISTINFKIGDKEWANETKQTMPGRFRLQKLLQQMVQSGCQYAIIETSSEGIAQYRHVGIDYDVTVFTNLSPEHIEAHGNYENYRTAKLKLMQSLKNSYKKTINKQQIQKISVVNADDLEAEQFLQPPADEKWTFGLKDIDMEGESVEKEMHAYNIVLKQHGVDFVVSGQQFHLKLLGEFNVSNALAAITVGMSQGIKLATMCPALEQVSFLPGRMEEIHNEYGFRIFVDYAHEPASLESVYQTVRSLRPSKIISVLGSQGGGRDKAKRPILGQLAGRYADYVIVTNEDPYDEDPEVIINDVMKGTLEVGKKLDENCFTILDRREALAKALLLAKPNDIVLITGKGSETVMAVAGSKMVPWDDRVVIRELLKK